MNRRNLLKGIGATGLLLAGTDGASASTSQAFDGDGGTAGELYLRFPDSDRDTVTIQSDCAIECCFDPCPCDHCICGSWDC